MFLVSGFFFILIIFTFVLVDYLKYNAFFKLFVKLGQVSFSAYIFHWIIIDVLKKIPISYAISEINLLFFVIFSVMFTYFISLIFFRIETFFISLGKKSN